MLNLALIGLGKWGRNYVKSLSNLSDCQIKYICSKTQVTLDNFSDRYIKVTNYKYLVNYGDIDGIIISTPGSTHFEIAKYFLEKGKNLLIEKPMVLDYQQAQDLLDVWKEHKPKVLIGHIQLYNPAYQKIKQLTPSIGLIKQINFEYKLSPVRDDMSVIWDWGPHVVSISLDLLKSEVIDVSCKAKANDSASIELSFTNVKVNAEISWLGQNKKRILRIIGEKGTLLLDDTKQAYGSKSPLTQELEEFVGAISNKRTITSDINLGIAVTKILSAMQDSANQGGKVVKIL